MTKSEALIREAAQTGTAEAAEPDHGRDLKRGAWANALAMIASNFRGIFTFLVARLLNPAAVGAFAVSFAATELLATLGTFGLDDTITTFIAREEALGRSARARALAWLATSLAVLQCLVLGALAALVVLLFGKHFGLDRQMALALVFMFCALPGMGLYRVSNSISRGRKVMRHNIFSRGLTETIATTLAFLLGLQLGFRTFAPQFGAVLGTAASGVVAFFLAAGLFRRISHRPEGFSVAAESRRMLGFSAQITAYDMLNALIVRLDVILLGCFIGRIPAVTLSSVGIYGAVVEVAGGLRKINQVVYGPIFAPVIAGMTVHGEQERAAAAFSRVSQWMLWLLLPAVAVLILAGPLILSIYGPAFPAGANWLIIVAIACGTNAFVGLAETVIMVQRPRINLFNSFVTAVVAIIADIWLISRFGVTGAAFGILLPYVLQGFLRQRALRSVFGWPNPWREALPPIIAAILGAVPAFVCRVSIHGISGQVAGSLVFLAIFGGVWLYYRRVAPPIPVS